jgi:hypothetical protein
MRVSPHLCNVVLSVLLCLCSLAASAANSAASVASPKAGSPWTAFGGLPEGCNGNIWAAIRGAGGDVYVGGEFTLCGSTPANRIARWDGAAWHSIGTGDENGVSGTVRAIALDGSTLYVGGGFLKAGTVSVRNIARWTGSSWSSLGGADSGVWLGSNQGRVNALVVGSDGLYIAGLFSNAGNLVTENMVRWDGTGWHALGPGFDQICPPVCILDEVMALAVRGNDVFVGGRFATVAGITVNNIARWNGSNWFALGTGASATSGTAGIYALTIDANAVFAGGYFTHIGGVAASHVGRWDGANWSALGTGVSSFGQVSALAILSGELYAGGSFFAAGGASASSLARWNGTAWRNLANANANFTPYMGVGVRALAASANDLIIAGDFDDPGVISGSHIIRWNGTAFSSVGDGQGNGINGQVFALASDGTGFYVGGRFSRAGAVRAKSVARWTGSGWMALGNDSQNGVQGEVRALAKLGGQVYIGGDYIRYIGAQSFTDLMRWDGSIWSAPGAGVSNPENFGVEVNALTAIGSNLYVGGNFPVAGGIPAKAIARWDGSNWSAIDNGVYFSFGGSASARVYAIGQGAVDVIAGGSFDRANLVTANGIAAFDGAQWRSFGINASNGVSGSFPAVLALAASAADIYAGGNFGLAGGMTVNGIARWNGSAWFPIVSGATVGMNNTVAAMAAIGSDLFVGGYFTLAGQTSAPHLAILRGGVWSATGTGSSNGTDAPIRALSTHGAGLLVGGLFTRAGGKISSGIALFTPPPPGFLFADDFE